MAEHESVRVTKDLIALLNAHDIEGYLKHIDPGYTGESENAGVVHGHDGVRQMLGSMFVAFPDFHVEVEQVIASGDHVVGCAILSGTNTGSFAGMAPTNRKASWHACNVSELRNGKVIRNRIYADNVSLMRQLGVLPVPKATSA